VCWPVQQFCADRSAAVVGFGRTKPTADGAEIAEGRVASDLQLVPWPSPKGRGTRDKLCPLSSSRRTGTQAPRLMRWSEAERPASSTPGRLACGLRHPDRPGHDTDECRGGFWQNKSPGKGQRLQPRASAVAPAARVAARASRTRQTRASPRPRTAASIFAPRGDRWRRN
jgi:hypothetical protein